VLTFTILHEAELLEYLDFHTAATVIYY